MKTKLLRIFALLIPALSLTAVAKDQVEVKQENILLCSEDGNCATLEAKELVDALDPKSSEASTLYEKLLKSEILKKQRDSTFVHSLAACGNACDAPAD